MNLSKEDYNQEPVDYCAHCLSLNIKELNNSKMDVCGECGNVDFLQTDINNWIEIYTKEYGEPFLSSEPMEED